MHAHLVESAHGHCLSFFCIDLPCCSLGRWTGELINYFIINSLPLWEFVPINLLQQETKTGSDCSKNISDGYRTSLSPLKEAGLIHLPSPHGSLLSLLTKVVACGSRMGSPEALLLCYMGTSQVRWVCFPPRRSHPGKRIGILGRGRKRVVCYRSGSRERELGLKSSYSILWHQHHLYCAQCPPSTTHGEAKGGRRRWQLSWTAGGIAAGVTYRD